MESDSIYLVVGLGNPGAEYADTRHNIGFRVIETLSKKLGEPKFAKKFHGRLAQTVHAQKKTLLLMPQTYMNRSGLSVGEAVSFYKISPETHLLVIYDELDLPVGSIRIRSKGSSGGHNGMNSVIESIGTEGFSRIRLGIGREDGKVVDRVLGKIPKSEKKIYETMIETAAMATEAFIESGINKAMNSFNTKGKTDEP